MLLNLLRITVVLALPVTCVIWTTHLAGPGAKLLENREFLALCFLQQLMFGGDVETRCQATDWFWLFRGAAWLGLFVALIPIVLFVGATLVSGRSRVLNAAIFSRMIPAAIGLVMANVLAQGVLLLLALTAFYLVYLGNPPLVAMGIGAAAVLGVAGGVVLSASDLSVDPVHRTAAMPVSREDAPELWALLDELAETMETPAPDTVVVGYDISFWMVASRVRLTGYEIEGTYQGRTLHLSLPMMHVLSSEELIAVVAHELSHFRGKDLAYSTRFLPVFSALSKARHDLDDGHDPRRARPVFSMLLSGASKLSARALLGILGTVFRGNVRRIARFREAEADIAATEVAEPTTVAQAMMKLPIYATAWEEMLADQATRIDRLHPRAMRLARHLADHARFEITPMRLDTLQKAALRARAGHPYDIHPAIRERLKNLGLRAQDVDGAAMRLKGAPSAAETLLPQQTLDGLEAGLMQDLFHRMRADRRIRDMPSMAGKRKVATLYQAVYGLLASLVTIAPDPAERFQEAARLGAEEMTDFDRLIFTEFCAGRHPIPDARRAAQEIVLLSGPEGADLMQDLTDRLLSPDEADVRDWLAEAFAAGKRHATAT